VTIVALLKIAYVVLILYVFFTHIRIVRSDRRLVVFRLGMCIGERGPGLVYLLPFVDRAIAVDIRESVMDIHDVTCGVLDGDSIVMRLAIRWQIVDPTKAVTAVADVDSAVRRVASTTACSLTGTITAGDALTQRASLAQDLHAALTQAVDAWGVKITGTEIADIRRVAGPRVR
jgi:regulator of protease activity HflC (stomatin/prohibitin superfamily)